MKVQIIILISFLLLSSCGSLNRTRLHRLSQQQIPLEKIGSRFVFEKYKSKQDGFISYYFRSKNSTDPLILTIQGSGCDSVYSKDKNGNVYGGLQTIAVAAVESRAAVLVVEKPYVETFYESAIPGNQKACSQEFRKHFERNSWLQILTQTLTDTIASQGLNPSRIIVMGHSEGATMAAAVAAMLPQVSHVIYASGGGGNPLYEAFLRRKSRARGNSKVEDEYIKEAIREWQYMVKHPKDTQKLFSGHSAQYWLSLGHVNPATDLVRSRAKVYVIQGTNDQDAYVDATDLLVSELVIAGKEVEYKRIIGASHSYEINGKKQMAKVLTEALEWSLKF